ncbi:5-oxoprolinase subunit PxpB [Psychroserpens damuponensis]|uniref:5-oxoprolinase subunit PxpB n=1 Tax=Psychroserpens damuponensis TaxID=943936 RepID=UPI00058EA274|nr:5-oxoprolinase subunit PxpB [Psychroserpens damuponensis]
MDYELEFRRFSERSILIEWPQEINEFILEDVLLFKKSILNLDIKSILQVNSAYNSLLIIYKCTIDNINDEILTLKACYLERKIVKKTRTKLFKIPVCYTKEFGLDLVEISEEKKLSIPEIIQLHSQPIYTVYFIGFLPGFLYLGGLDEQLHFPRKTSPRREVKKGAVAIGGAQTGIYPNASPGGWHIIGNSPVDLFMPNNDSPCFAKAGDSIEFVPISRDRYDAILHQVKQGDYNLESEVVDG